MDSSSSRTRCAAADTAAEDEAVEHVFDTVLRKIIIDVACGVHRAAKTGALPYSFVMSVSAAAGGNLCPAGRDPDPSRSRSLAATADGTATGEAGGADRSRHEADADVASVAAIIVDPVAKRYVGAANADGASAPSEREAADQCKTQREEEAGNDDGGGAKRRRVEFTEGRKPASVPTAAVAAGTSNGVGLCNNAAMARGVSSKPHKGIRDIYGKNPGKEPRHPIPCPNGCGRSLSCGRIASHLEKCLGLNNATARRRASGSSGGAGGDRRNGAGSGSSAGRGGAGRGGKAGKHVKPSKRKSTKNA